MRLRYLHLQNYPPLHDVAVCFPPPILEGRECAIRFVVGVNGSGKTHLLQAVAEVFLALSLRQNPHFPVTLAWELGEGSELRTLVFDSAGRKSDSRWWETSGNQSRDMTVAGWNRLVAALRSGDEKWNPLIREGNWPGQGVGLPSSVMVYSSGCLDAWQWKFRREPEAVDVDIVSQSKDYNRDQERPAGWTREQEREYLAEKNDLDEVRLKPLADQEGAPELCLLFDSCLLKCALLAVSLRQAMKEFDQHQMEDPDRAFERRSRDCRDGEEGLRRLLSEVDWKWPVSVVFQMEFKPESWGGGGKKKDLAKVLLLLATEVIREPEPNSKRRLYFDLREKHALAKAHAKYTGIIRAYFGEVGSYEYVGDALVQFLGGADASPYEGFKKLLDLQRQGLLADMNLVVKKADTEDVLLFDELSDGEREYLCRMALFHLLENESDALLLLDEPEVHFNDRWKREIVNIIDSVLKGRANDVLIATHSSIALTDVFNEEIILFDKRDGATVPVEIRSTTFGADPSEVMIRLFGVPDSIGERALEYLDGKLDRKWTQEEIPALEKLLQQVGPGYHRSELRGILRKLKDQDAAQN